LKNKVKCGASMDDLLQQGIAAYRAGKRDEARKFFIAALKQNRNDERTWGWMYNVCNNDTERIDCIKQMLRINPKNEKASQLLAKLTIDNPVLPQPSVSSPKLESHSTTEQTPPPVQSSQVKATDAMQKTPDPKQSRNLLIGIGAVFFICIICLLVIFIPKGTSQDSPQATKSQLIVPAGQLAQYVDTYSNYDEVFVTKKDGSLDDRSNDLEELCLDYLFYRNRIIEYEQAGQTEKATEARTAWNEINVWLTEYNEDDVGTMWTIIEKRNK
jgi:tetratricopeptide (TPR) repeat protein